LPSTSTRVNSHPSSPPSSPILEMGYEKDSASRDLDLEQAPLEVIKVDVRHS
ncbi:uncharacterized protein JCM15063_006367, partial [Sporobolomyces koalae]|uniref:uncharacterized protein n=1 Tax=Sporobolomyces koalae TaxID=500713 RepID=UPI00317CF66B